MNTNTSNLILLLVALLSFDKCDGQLKTITGKVLDEFNLTPLEAAKIQSKDKAKFGFTDRSGNFKIQIPIGIDTLIISSIGAEWAEIKVDLNCNNLEVILLASGTYDYMSTRKINKQRVSRFNKLPALNKQAVRKGYFTSEFPCFSYVFHKY